MKIIEFAKKGLKLIAMVGNSAIIGAIGTVGVLAVPTIAVPIKICTAVSSYILTGIVTDKTDEYIDKTIDDFQNEIAEMKKEISQ